MRPASQEGRRKISAAPFRGGTRRAKTRSVAELAPGKRAAGRTRRRGRPMVTKLFACAVAGAFLFPQAAFAKDGSTATQSRAEWKQAGALPLPPIPYLETIPWLSTEETGPRQ